MDINKAREVIATGTAAKLDGTLLDTFTAQVIVTIYDKVNDRNKRLFETMDVTEAARICLAIVSKGQAK